MAFFPLITSSMTSDMFYICFLIFLGYFLLVMLYYLVFAAIGFVEDRKRFQQSKEEDYPALYFSNFTFPVSIIIPAHNEEEWINDSVKAAINLNYPEFEVIVVDDGSTDKTLSILRQTLALEPIDMTYTTHYADGKVREFYKSSKYPRVTVISKLSGYKKAGALNAGLNLAKYKYICEMDADTILEPDALLKVMAVVQRDPDKVIGIGSYFGLSNGFKIEDGRVVQRKFSYKPLLAYQNLEYIRGFIGSRIGWSKFNIVPILAGGFAIWRRDILYELGGFSRDFSSEDAEFTFRVQSFIAGKKDKGYKIVTLPYFAGWTEAPDNIKSLVLQRNRWYRVTEETAWKYKYMLFNPKYGMFGSVMFPYFMLYEVFGTFFEVVSIFMVAAGWIIGTFDFNIFLAYLLFMILFQAIVSLLSLLDFLRGQKMMPVKYIIYLALLSMFEMVWYRWIIEYAKISGAYDYSQKVKTQDRYVRTKRTL